MTIFTNTKKIHILINIFIFSIFTYIFFFSTKNIINLWTFSEFHINYSAGFIRRGFLGEILRLINQFGYFDKTFFSFIFYLFSILNVFLILQIIKNITDNILVYIFLSLNPALILFSFYDLGGYARFEIFGIFLILLHTFLLQLIYNYKITLERYFIFLAAFVYPFFFITILIHEINLFFILIHVYFFLKILNFGKKINKTNIIALVIFIIPILLVTYMIFNIEINKEKIQIILESLKYKDNVEIWILNSIAAPLSERFISEINFMINPILNPIYYLFIFIFFALPIYFVLAQLSLNLKKDTILMILTVFPFCLLFLMGRDWGRWIHLIIISLFCFFCKNENKIKIIKTNINQIIFLMLIFIQLTMTRIPHCCNIINKNIHIYGGLIPKIKIFYKMQFKNFDVKKRFKTFY